MLEVIMVIAIWAPIDEYGLFDLLVDSYPFKDYF